MTTLDTFSNPWLSSCTRPWHWRSTSLTCTEGTSRLSSSLWCSSNKLTLPTKMTFHSSRPSRPTSYRKPEWSTLIGRDCPDTVPSLVELYHACAKFYAVTRQDKWLPCTERIYLSQLYAIKNQRKARNIFELVLYGIRELA